MSNPVDPRTPVVVGAAAISTRAADREPAALMIAACHEAERDAGVTGLLARAEAVFVPKGSWQYHDAARLVARGIGCPEIHTVVADLGVLQTTPFAQAASAIARGDLDVAVLAGGEARWRLVQGGGPDTDDAGAVPDELLRPDGMIVSREEIDARLVSAASQYALVENARRFADGQSLVDHAAVLTEWQQRFAAVAAANPDAWDTGPFVPGRPIAFPYGKGHVSQWNVDQAAAFIMCSAETAAAGKIPRDGWIFPHAIVESNAMIPVSQRAALHRSPGFAIAGARACELAATGIDEMAYLDLYSCFPIAVRTQCSELGIDPARPLTLTGGMVFGGGPLNNYVLQALAKMVTALRSDPGARGLVTAISGLLTKQAVSIWSSQPPAAGYRFADVAAETRAATETVPVVREFCGRGVVATSTVLFDRAGTAERGVVIAAVEQGRARTVAVTFDAATLADMTATEWCGRSVHIDLHEKDGIGTFTLGRE